MAAIELEGNNLGEKHKHYNKLLKETIENNQVETKGTENDVNNLIKIDVACHNKDIDYILSIYKSPDILYVIRALEKSIWLITDPEYSHIINPEYLQNKLFPEMTSKAKTKLMKNIKLHLKDESLVESFYNNETNLKLAMKWLPNCSVTFIENNIEKHMDHMQPHILKRLCEKYFTVFEIFMKKSSQYIDNEIFESTAFLMHVHTEKYFNIIDEKLTHHSPKFNAKRTQFLMKKIPNRIIDNFVKYCRYIDIPTFVQYLKRKYVKGFLLEQANKNEYDKNGVRCCNWYSFTSCFFNYDTISIFIKRMPKEEQFDFVKEVFIDKTHEKLDESSVAVNSEISGKIRLCNLVKEKNYRWYEFAPFETAFTELKILMSTSPSHIKHSIVTVLTKCLDHNLENTRNLIKYLNDKHANDSTEIKYDLIIDILSSTEVYNYDEETWNILNEIFSNMNIYSPKKKCDDKNNDYAVCVESIILYKAIHGDNVPEVIEEKFSFTTFKSLTHKLGSKEKGKLFGFLLEHLFKKIEKIVIKTEDDFGVALVTLENILELLSDWNKELSDFPSVYNKIKKLARLKRDHSWKTSLSHIYNINKSWRRLMFEESVIMHPSEEVCMNALKHDPKLLSRYGNEVEDLRCNNSVSLRRVNRKLRIYWPQTLASEWADEYIKRLDTVDSHKALIRGLCIIQPQELLIDFVKKYTPKEAKINWLDTNVIELSMQRNIAINMHLSRPQLHPDLILGYAKGDYLQYALPSLIAIFYNLNITQSRKNIPKLLNAPVSLQKHGIRFVFMKLNTEELKEICSNLWKNSKNATLRKVLFEFTHKLLCQEKNSSKAIIIWELLELFVDNLSYEEDKSIYKLLPDAQKNSISVRGYYFVKVYKYLQSLIENCKKDKETYESYIDKLISITREEIDCLSSDFVAEMILQLLDNKFYNIKDQYSVQSANYGVIPILSAYLLNSKNLEDQAQKTEKILLPLIQRSLTMWDEEGKSFVHTHIQELLKCFTMDLNTFVFDKKLIVPYKMFRDVQGELKKLPLSQNYLMLTKWNLTVTFTKIMMENTIDFKNWDELCTELAPLYGKLCSEYLKEEVASHFPRIYILFSKALQHNLDNFIDYKVARQIYRSLLSDQSFIPGYLAGINLLLVSEYDDRKEEMLELSKVFLAHPSIEVKMHYNCIWNTNPLMPTVES